MRFDVLFRLDAGGSTGLGHLRRCLSLADAFRDLDLRVGFISRDPRFVRSWTKKRFPVIPVRSGNVRQEIPELLKLFSKNPPKLLILDHYEYLPADASKLSAGAGALAYMDDMARWKKFPVDAVINHNVDAHLLPYPKKGPALFLGTKYSLMSREAVRLRKKAKPAGLNLFMTLGGGAEPAQIRKLISVFQNVRKSVPNAHGFLAPGLGFKTRVPARGIHWIEPKDFLRAMSRCHAAVSSSGVTSYELACLGIPAVLLTVVDNQAGICREMARRKCALDGGWIQKSSAEKIGRLMVKLCGDSRLRKSIRRNQQKLVGVRGPARLARELKRKFLS